MFILGFILLLLGGPRVFNVAWWLVQPVRYNLAFNNVAIPLLGILFVPWTTLMYVAVAPGGVSGWDGVWIAFGLIADLLSYTGSGFAGKKQMSSKPASTTTPPQAQ